MKTPVDAALPKVRPPSWRPLSRLTPSLLQQTALEQETPVAKPAAEDGEPLKRKLSFDPDAPRLPSYSQQLTGSTADLAQASSPELEASEAGDAEPLRRRLTAAVDDSSNPTSDGELESNPGASPKAKKGKRSLGKSGKEFSQTMTERQLLRMLKVRDQWAGRWGPAVSL